jgi:pimeloyl-ACP methyl ester carboxylesterase
LEAAKQRVLQACMLWFCQTKETDLGMPQLKVGERKINYREVGEGPPVILLHSSSSHSGQWKNLSDRIADKFRIFAPDFFGYGKSDQLPNDERPYFHHDIQIVSAILDTLDKPVHLVGHSLGGTIAARAALEHADKIASLILIEPVLFNLIEETGDPRREEYLELAHAMMVLTRFGKDEQAARLFIDFWVGPGSLDELDTDTREYVVGTIGRVSDDWYGISSYAPECIAIADLHRITMPSLVICAAQTKPSAKAVAEVLRKTIPGAEYREVPNAGHMSPITHFDEVNELIIDFISRHTDAGV